MQKALHTLSVVSLVMVLLVMTAGSIVRMTGSGMGCPDWPKCFGYYIPPTDIATLTWQPERHFRKGNIIIKDEALLVAQYDFTTGHTFDPAPWQPYTKHDYALFNPVHTWIEFINRLLGALAGVPALFFLLGAVVYIRKDFVILLLAGAGIALLAFAAWLGKLVVDGNLVPHSITYHMFSALALTAVYTGAAVRLRKPSLAFSPMRNTVTVTLGVVALSLLLVQILMGTGVREEIDAMQQGGLTDRTRWVESLTWLFKVHRSFSLLVLGAMALFAVRVIQTRTISTWPRLVLAFVVIEVLAGMGLSYLGMPAVLQPVHLVIAALNFVVGLYVLLLYISKTRRA
jgi:cytochrome c oxidase assembly protein subunit 15